MKFISSFGFKIFSWILFVTGVVGLVLCGVDIKGASNIFTLISGVISSVGSVFIQIYNSVKNKQPQAKG